MIRNLKHLLAGGLWIMAGMALGAEFHVSPSGDDTHPGTRSRPLRTLEGARDAVRRINGDMTGDIIVWLAAGDYPITSPVLFTSLDSGTNGHRVIYRARDGVGSARLTGGRRVTGWSPHHEGIWKARIEGVGVFHTLYENGRRVRKARHPNYVHDPAFPTAQAPYLTSADGLPKGQKGVRSSWITWHKGDFDPTGLEVGQMKINIFPWGKCDWHRWICQVTEIDAARRKITFDNMGDATEILSRARYFLEDHPAFLDAPGEFYLDEKHATLYYIPREGDDPNSLEIVAPVTLDLIRIQGDSADAPVHHLVFDGLTLEYTGAISPTLHYWTHGWGRSDHAMVWMSNARHIEVRRCHLRNSGRSGILMVGDARHNLVSGCWIEQMGVNGITLSNAFRIVAGEPEALCERNVLTNNKIHDVGQLSLYAECVGVFNASDNEISHSEFFRSPRYATTMRGNTSAQYVKPYVLDPTRPPAKGNVFRYLRIYDCGQDSGDMGAVHTAAVNVPDGDAINTFEHIVVGNTRAVAGMNDVGPDGIFLDWPFCSMHQVFRNFHIEGSQNRPFRSNGPGNQDSARTENVSWKAGFDHTRMEYESIGLTADFPSEFGGRPAYAVSPPPLRLRGETSGHSSIRLSWEAPPGPKPALYTVFRDGKLAGTSTEPGYLDAGLSEATTYRYRVAAQSDLFAPLSASSAETAVTTDADTTPPAVMGLWGEGTTVTVVFSKPVEQASAENRANYRLDPERRIGGAALLDPRVVMLTLAPSPTHSSSYTLVVQGVRDLARTPNTMPQTVALPMRWVLPTVHYRLDESEGEVVHDSAAGAQHGRIMAGCLWRPEERGGLGALELNGETDWVRLPEGVTLGAGDFSLMAWVWRNSTGQCAVLAQGLDFSAPGQWSLGWEWPVGAANIAFRSQNRYWTSAPDSIEAGRWIHVAFVRKGTVGYSYINGNPSGGPHDLTGLGDLRNGKPLLVGRREYESAPAWFGGRIADLRVYDVALDEAEIHALAATGTR